MSVLSRLYSMSLFTFLWPSKERSLQALRGGWSVGLWLGVAGPLKRTGRRAFWPAA